jgi:hypothetical protein
MKEKRGRLKREERREEWREDQRGEGRRMKVG